MSRELSVVGLNHAVAPVEVREAVAPRPAESGRLCRVVLAGAGLSDAVVLSTCSRFEVYGVMDESDREALIAWLERRAGRPLRDILYCRAGQEAVGHLFRVVSGLDSWIVGETEVLGQVKAAYQSACAEQTVSRPCHLAFQRALYVGKKVRNETAIVGGIASIGGAAAVMARRIFSKLEDRRILVFGAGEIAAATVRHLAAKGVRQIWVANRSPERARALAADLGGEALDLAEGFGRLAEADIAVFSTGASQYLLDETAARETARKRGGKPLFIIDLGLPRNVDPAAAREGEIYLYDMDDLKRVVRESLSRREADLERAEELVRGEAAACWERVSRPAPLPEPVAA